MNINDIFDNRQAKRPANPRVYDVRITLNKSGRGRFAIRFGFINDAVKAFGNKQYIQISRVDKLQDRIYFRLFDDKANLDAHKLSKNAKTDTPGFYTAVTPSEAAEKIYRTKWIGKTFKIQYDTEHKLYYIDQEAQA